MSKKLLFNFNREDIQNYTYIKYVGTIITATNTLEKPIKSAILKGQTLVNLISDTSFESTSWTKYAYESCENGIITFVGNGQRLVRYAMFKTPVKQNQTYTAFVKIKSDCANVGIELETNDGDTYIRSSNYTTSETNDFVLLKAIITVKNHNTLTFVLRATELINGNVYFKEPILLEGDYTNQEIPFFSGMQSVQMPVLTTTGKNTLNPNEITLDSSSHVNPESYTYSEGVYTFKNSRSNNQMRFTITKQNASDKILYEVLEVKDLNGNVTPHQITMEGSNDKAYWFSIIRPDWGNVGEVKIKLGVDSLEPYKTNILTVNEDVTLRGVGDVKDELDLLTGEVTQRIEKTTITGDFIPGVVSWERNNNSETMCFECFSGIPPFQWNQIISADWLISNDGYNPSLTHEYFNPYGGYGIFRIKRSRLETEDANGFKKWLNENPITIYHPVIGSESFKTVDLSILDQNENKVSSISSFNDTTHITASSETIPPIFEGYLATKEVE